MEPIYFFNSMEFDKTVEQMVEKTGMDELAAEELMKKQLSIFMPIAALVFTPLIIVAFAGLMFFGGNIVLGGNSDFKTIFSLNTYVSVLGALGLLLKVPLIIAKGSTDVLTSLAILVPAGSEDSLLYKLLNIFDVIIIWESIVIAIGLAVIYDWEQKRANILIVSIWGLVAVIVAIFHIASA